MSRQASRILPLLAAISLVGATLAACGSDEGGSGDEGRLAVVASTSIIGALAEEIGGETVTVASLMGPGVDPHTFEMTPGDVRTLAEADLVLINGLELDDYLLDDIESANDTAEIVVVTDGVDLLDAGEDANHGEEEAGAEDEHGEFDPHVWQDPQRVKVMVANIAAALEKVDPDRATAYQDNATAYQATLDETDTEIRTLIDAIPAERRKLVTNHDAFAYFADRYGLEIVGTVIPGTSSEADPSAGDIARLSELIETEGVTAIFAETLIDPKVAEALAEDTGVEIVHGLYTGQVGEPGSGAETVHAMLLANATKISEALR